MRELGRLAVRVLAMAYLAGIFLDGVGYEAPLHALPQVFRYLLDLPERFADADKTVITYHAEGWVCSERRWQELDPKPYFPMHRGDMESRFHRTLQLYHDELTVKRALAAYLTEAHNGADTNAADGIASRAVLGGVRLSIVRQPMPRPGDEVLRFAETPLQQLGTDSTKRVLFEPLPADLKTDCSRERGAEVSP